MNSLFYFLSEGYLIFSLLFLLVYGVVYSTAKKYHYPIVITSHIWLSILIFSISIILLSEVPNNTFYIFYSSLTIDSYTTDLKILILVSLIFSSLISFDFVRKEKINSFEYVSLILIAVLGMLLLISSNNLLMIFLSLELQSLSFYILTSYQRTNEKSIEAGLKYFIFGAFSTGILLFGSSLIYGTTGLFYLNDFSVFFSFFQKEQLPFHIFLIALIFMLIGFLFKLYAVPFHVWVPDIYEGSPTHITSLFATVPVLSVLGLFSKILMISFYDLIAHWSNILLLCCILSMVIGCFAAIYQKKIKRLLAYSSIGHVGFFLLGLVVGTPEGIQATFFYIISYVVMTLCFFSALLSLRKKIGFQLIENLKELHILYKINAVLAITIAISLFSMAGIPPLLGFFSKFYIFINAREHSLFIFLMIAVITSAISSFYYLNCIKIMYFESSRNWTLFDQIDKSRALALGITTFILLFFFLYPSFIVSLSYKLSFALLV